MTTTSMLTSTSATLSTTTSTLGEDGSIDKDKRNLLLGSTALTTGTLIGENIVENHVMNEIYDKYASAYVESMSDEELAIALEKLDLLESSMSENTTKTI